MNFQTDQGYLRLFSHFLRYVFHKCLGLLSSEENEEYQEEEEDQNNRMTTSLPARNASEKAKLHLPIISQPQDAPPDQQPRARLVRQNVVDHDRGFPHSYSEQSKSRSSFASSDFGSISLKSSSLQVDDNRF